jgi:hypothetical protein
MPQITKAARTALVARLGDPAYGFNAAHAAIYSEYGLTAPIAVNWTPNAPANVRQLYQSYHTDKDIVAAGIAKFPIVCVYGESAVNKDDEKFHQFAGVVQIAIDFFSSFKAEKALPSADDTIDSIEDALVTCINSQSWTAANTSTVVYEGDIMFQRFAIKPDDQNWLQLLRTRLKFAVYQ